MFLHFFVKFVKKSNNMNELVQKNIKETKDSMEHSIAHLEKELTKIRAGKASPQMLDSVKIDYYGNPVPISQIANISTPDAKTITIQPWEKNMISPIEKAILAANLGFNPQNDGTLVRIPVPPLTEERRKELVKKVKAEGENAKVAIRNIRKNANEKSKKFEKDGVPEDEIKKMETEVQKMTDNFIQQVDKIIAAKEKDIMTI